MMEAYQAKFGTPLAPPKTWEDISSEASARLLEFATGLDRVGSRN